MHKVQSKFKNPDKLIEKLKSESQSKSNRLDYNFKRIGELQNQIESLKK